VPYEGPQNAVVTGSVSLVPIAGDRNRHRCTSMSRILPSLSTRLPPITLMRIALLAVGFVTGAVVTCPAHAESSGGRTEGGGAFMSSYRAAPAASVYWEARVQPPAAQVQQRARARRR
jgi:hypothetical protein